jgi:alpha-glucosidase
MKISKMALTVVALTATTVKAANTYKLTSPDGSIAVNVTADDSIHFSVAKNNTPVVKNITVGMALDNGTTLGLKPRVASAKKASVNNTVRPVVPMKFSEINNNYNSLTLKLKGNYAVEFRVFNNGFAHRIVTSLAADSINVLNEIYNVTIADTTVTANIQEPWGFRSPSEEAYSHKSLGSWTASDNMSAMPVLLTKDDAAVLFCETNLRDYPGMYLKSDGNGTFHGVYAKAPIKFGPDGDRSMKILEEAPYIARTVGSRAFPWRYVAMGTTADIITQTLSTQLAEPCVLTDTDWIKPGQASWEWWNQAHIYGDDVNFVCGRNLDTYKYYVDFASKYGMNYIVMDEGWAKSTLDPFTPNPNIDLHQLIQYANKKDVGILLWLTWLCVENNFDQLFKTAAEWGIKGFKIDFMDRSDQWMVNFYERVVKEAARYNLVIDFHGAYKPSGLETTYPNLLSYEGVRGMEWGEGCRPDNSIYYPLMRNAVGPMDYTPGAMIGTQPEASFNRQPNASSIGTRAYQMALFVVFESGIQMLADSPTLYYKNPDCTKFITSVPVTWDETRVLSVKPGENVIVAKRKGDKWFIGGMNAVNYPDWTNFTLNLDFLAPNTTYTMTSFSDGINAPNQAMDYRKKTETVSASTKLDIKMSRNGGWCAVLEPR